MESVEGITLVNVLLFELVTIVGYEMFNVGDLAGSGSERLAK